MGDRRVALVHGVPFGGGGLGIQTANAAAALAGAELHAVGPAGSWPRSDPPPVLQRHDTGAARPRWGSWPIVRASQGRAQLVHDVAAGRLAAASLERIKPSICYTFTQVGLESLRWCRRHGVQTVLESPNGHLRAFRRVYLDEHTKWCAGSYRGHPTDGMVDRVLEEYELADRIRVSSEWARASLVAGGIPAAKVTVLQQPVDLARYRPAPAPDDSRGPLRVVFVGTLDLRKGFVYLLDALRALEGSVAVEIVGGTVDRCTRRLLEERTGARDLRVAPGDPRGAYHRAELSVLPTLEDGSPFAAAEAMACALPIVVTPACGAAEWVDPGRTGWIVPARDAGAIAGALADALRRRGDLPAMGRAARADTERRAGRDACDAAVAAWVLAGTDHA